MTYLHWALVGCLVVNIALLWMCAWAMDKWHEAESRLATLRRLYRG